METSEPQQPRTEICVYASQCHKSIYLDTETMGFSGIPFLIQYRRQGEDTQLFHVLERSPQEAIELVESFCELDVELIAYNATFDLKMLSKLATVASLVQDWSFEEVWAAERIWRPETSYADRLKLLKLAYPPRVVDLMIAAESLPPLGEQFLAAPRVELPEFPIAAIPELETHLRKKLTQRPFYTTCQYQPDLSTRLQISVHDSSTTRARQQITKVQRDQDYSRLGRVGVGFKADGMYSLKSVARLLGYSGPTPKFEFLDRFGRIPNSPCPTYQDRDLYERLFKYCQTHQRDQQFLNYALGDIDMLAHLDAHYRSQSGFGALQHEYDLVPVIANLELYGVHVDPGKVRDTRSFYESRAAESAAALKTAGLDNFNSSTQVVHFVNRLLRKTLPRDQIASLDPIEDMQQETLVRLHARLKSSAVDPQAIELLRHLIRARLFSRRPTFFDPVVGDTIYPQFHIRGTVSDRMTTSRPSIQNMPAKASEEEQEESMQFRAPFTPPPGYRLLIGDADQFEMRLAAAEANETTLINAFSEGVDPHSLTALKVFGARIRQEHAGLKAASDDQILQLLNQKDPRVKPYRGKGKILNFATIYGATKWGIARQAGTTPEEAEAMLTAFSTAYRAIQAAIDTAHGQITVAQPVGSGSSTCQRVRPQTTRITNRLGVTRSFELALRLIDVLLKLCEDGELDEDMPDVSAVREAYVQYRDKVWPPKAVVRSQLGQAARRLQAYCHRQAFNFRVQSLGAGYIKQLQARVSQDQVTPGLWGADKLPILPGINVHDELHFYAKGQEAAQRVHQVTSDFTNRLSSELTVPIIFTFSEVLSWAEKA